MKTPANSTSPPAQESVAANVASSPLLDRKPLTVRATDSIAGTLSGILGCNAWCAVVLDDKGGYLGLCTLRSLADLALLVSAEGTRMPSTLDYHREGVSALAARLAAKGDMPVAEAIDPAVPVLRGSQSVSHALATLVRLPPVAIVIDDKTPLGVLTLDRALRTLQLRGGFADRHPA
jgi:CBS domain-containing protein